MSVDVWTVLGFIAQGFFGLRFLVQWLVSEKRGESVIPTSFWYFSLIGSTGLLAYAIHKRDPVFIAGYSLNFIIYFRNLELIKRKAAASDRNLGY